MTTQTAHRIYQRQKAKIHSFRSISGKLARVYGSAAAIILLGAAAASAQWLPNYPQQNWGPPPQLSFPRSECHTDCYTDGGIGAVAAAINEVRQQQQQQLQFNQQMLMNAMINAQQARNERLQSQMMAASRADASQRATAPSQEVLLVQSGFKLVTALSQEQKRAVRQLAAGTCSAVQYNGNAYYVYPTATKDRIYVGKQAQFNAYKKALVKAKKMERTLSP
jgi:hypothetical protein